MSVWSQADHPLRSFAAELACDSEIELDMLRALLVTSRERDWGSLCIVGDSMYPIHSGDPILAITPQLPIGRYRADFALTLHDGEKHSALVVECDGHDFHDRTKEQASNDRRRDRAMQSEGFTVFRFTGTDIHHGADGCAVQCLDLLTQMAA